MALFPCPECKNEVSDKAAACPRCGAPVAPQSTPTFDVLTGRRLDEGGTQGVAGVPVAPVVKGPVRAVQAAPPLAAAGSPAGSFRPFGFLLGLGLLAWGGYLLFSYIPEHDPANMTVASGAEAVFGDRTFLKPEAVGRVRFFGWALVLFGLAQIGTGSVKRR